MAKTTARKKRLGKTPSRTVGIDLGGTKVATALVDRNGKLLAEARKPAVPEDMVNQDPRQNAKPPTTAEVKRHIAYLAGAVAEAAIEALETGGGGSIAGVGLASAGPMNIDRGTLEYPSNFKGWKIVPLVELVTKELARRGLKSKLAFQNDAIAAALGEGWVGRARGCSTYAMITVGTGIGTGVIFNGRPAQSGGMGSEWGQMLVNIPGLAHDRASYNFRTVEAIASGTGLIRRARERGFDGTSASQLAVAAKEGNSLALDLFEQGAEALAALLCTLSLGFHPEKFVVTGGLLGIREHFLPRTIQLYKDLINFKNPKFAAPIQVSQLGTHAGVIGAARLPWLAEGTKR